MSISPILKSELDIRTIYKSNGKSSGTSIIYLKGYKTDCVLRDCFHDQVFKAHSYYVIFTSADAEEVHDLIISLVTQDAILLEEVIISNPQWLYDYFDDTADHVSDFAIQHPNKIYFHFLDNDLWNIEIFQQPRFMWSSIFLLDVILDTFDGKNCKGVHRKLWCFKTYFRFQKNSDLLQHKQTIKEQIKTIYQSFTTQKKETK